MGENAEERRTKGSVILGPGSSGGLPSSTRPTPSPSLTSKCCHQHSRGARPQAPGKSVGHSRGRTVRHWLKPVRGRRPVKFHCRRRHRWDLPVLRYHEIMVIYPYPFLVVITLLLSWIIFINDFICILTGSPK